MIKIANGFLRLALLCLLASAVACTTRPPSPSIPAGDLYRVIQHQQGLKP